MNYLGSVLLWQPAGNAGYCCLWLSSSFYKQHHTTLDGYVMRGKWFYAVPQDPLNMVLRCSTGQILSMWDPHNMVLQWSVGHEFQVGLAPHVTWVAKGMDLSAVPICSSVYTSKSSMLFGHRLKVYTNHKNWQEMPYDQYLTVCICGNSYLKRMALKFSISLN